MPPETEVLLQLAKGLAYIHQKELVHRDIKPQNVLIWVNPNTNQILMKWADFGFSKRVNENGTYTMSAVKGTYDYFAPEILKYLDEDSSTDNEAKKRGTVKSDVFAEGLVFGYFLSRGVHPFGSSSYEIGKNMRTKKLPILPGKLILKINKEHQKYHNNFAVKHKFRFIMHVETKNIPMKIRNIIQKMLVKEPIEERITSSDVVNLLEKEKNDRVKKVTKTFPQLLFNIHHSFLLEYIPDVRLSFTRKFKFGRF